MKRFAGLLFLCLAATVHAADDEFLKAFFVDTNLIVSDNAPKRAGLHFLNALYVANPNLDPKIALSLAEDVERGYRGMKTFDDPTGEIERLAKVAIRASVTIDPTTVFEVADMTYGAWLRQEQRIRNGLLASGVIGSEKNLSWHNSVMLQPQSIEDALTLSKKNKLARQAVSTYLSPVVNKAELDDPIEVWMRLNPAAATALNALLLRISVKDLGTKIAADGQELRFLREQLANLQRKLGTLKISPTALPSVPKEPPIGRDDLAAYLALNNALMGAARDNKGIQVIGSLIDAQLRLIDALQRFGIGSLTDAGMMSSGAAILIGLSNTLMAFADSRPSQTEIIIGELRTFRKELLQVFKELFENLKTMHDSLFQISTFIYERIDRMDVFLRYQTKATHELLTENTFQQVILGNKVDAVRDDLFSLAADASDRELSPLYLRLEWDEMTFEAFQSTLDRFWTCATRDAKRTSETGPRLKIASDASFKDLSLLDDIASIFDDRRDSWERIGALAQIVRLHGGRFASSAEANANLWGLCADAYVKLARRWPRYYAKYDLKRSKLIPIQSVGAEVALNVKAMALGRKDAGSHIVGDALSLYARLARSLRGTVEEFLRLGVKAENSAHLRGIDPFRPLSAQKESLIKIVPTKICISPSPTSFTRPAILELYPKLAPVADQCFELSEKQAAALESAVPFEIRALVHIRAADVRFYWRPHPMEQNVEEVDISRLFDKKPVRSDYDGKLAISITAAVTFKNSKEAEVIVPLLTYMGQQRYRVTSGAQIEKDVNVLKKYYYRLRPDENSETAIGTDQSDEATVMKRLWSEFVEALEGNSKFVVYGPKLESEGVAYVKPIAQPHVTTLKEPGRKSSPQMPPAPLGADKQETKEGVLFQCTLTSIPLLTKHWQAAVQQTREAMVQELKGAFTAPSGAQLTLAKRVDAARNALLRLTQLAFGSWLSKSTNGKALLEALKQLPSGKELLQAVTTNAQAFAYAETSGSALSVTLLPVQRAISRYKGIVDNLSQEIGNSDFGVHPVLANTLGRLDAFAVELSRKKK